MIDLSWMVGTWHGTVNDDPVLEAWSTPRNGTMMGMFRWDRGDHPRLYELMTIRIDDHGATTLLIRHFGADFAAWEEPNKPVRFELVKAERDHAVWRELDGQAPSTLHYRVNIDRLEVWFEREQGPPPVTGVFYFSRV